jgi:hypothetical protein
MIFKRAIEGTYAKKQKPTQENFSSRSHFFLLLLLIVES